MHEKAREVAWRAESQGFRHRMDRRRAIAQPVDGVLQPQRIRVKARRDAGALPEQMEEMRPRQAGYLDPDIDILRIGRRLEWKSGLQLGLTSTTPPVGIRIQLAAFWGKRD